MKRYLVKEAMYLKQFRIRYMVLKGNNLYSYKSNKKKILTETVNLQIYNHDEISADGPMRQFDSACSNNKQKRVLVTSSMQELDDWLNNPSNH